jgi:micrococcal nuclease
MKALYGTFAPRLFVLAGFVAGFALLLALLPPVPKSQASIATNSFQGLVISVSDGDSITVRSGDQNIRVRLAEIDAPERGQPWGTKSREALSGLVGGKDVSVYLQGEDRYGRMIALIKIGDHDINKLMLERGAAWAYRDFLRDPSAIGIENSARAQGLGLWAMPESERVAPWDYRAARRTANPVIVGR